MRAAVIDRYGEPAALHLAEVADARCGPTQLLVRIRAAAVNVTDTKVRSGQLRDVVPEHFPMILGWDAVGVVEAVGAGAGDWRAGDAVWAMWDQDALPKGSYAELVAVDASWAAPAPTRVSELEAATVPLSAMTAFEALRDLALPAGSSLGVAGATGVVGSFVVQLAKHQNLEVVAIVRPRHRERALELGADRVIDASSGDTDTPMLDGLVHTAGPTSVVALVRDGGRYVSVLSDGMPAPERAITTMIRFVEPDAVALAQIAAALDDGVITPHLDDAVDLAQASAAHARLEAGQTGRTVLVP